MEMNSFPLWAYIFYRYKAYIEIIVSHSIETVDSIWGITTLLFRSFDIIEIKQNIPTWGKYIK